jgi:uroporphyrinogen-III synthase
MTDAPLAGLHIVVTRPRAQAAALMQGIARLGGDGRLLPLLEIAPPAEPHLLAAQLSRLARFRLAIFISPNAVQYGMAAIMAAGGLPAGLRIATVGQGSARALREFGLHSIIAPPEGADSESLLALPELQDVVGWPVLILRGDGGRELLGDTLKARGAEVEYAACYRRTQPHHDVSAWQADAITVTSSEALAHLRKLLGTDSPPPLLATPLFVLHPRIAEKARQLGFTDVHTTATGDDGLLAGLVAWANQRTISS